MHSKREQTARFTAVHVLECVLRAQVCKLCKTRMPDSMAVLIISQQQRSQTILAGIINAPVYSSALLHVVRERRSVKWVPEVTYCRQPTQSWASIRIAAPCRIFTISSAVYARAGGGRFTSPIGSPSNQERSLSYGYPCCPELLLQQQYEPWFAAPQSVPFPACSACQCVQQTRHHTLLGFFVGPSFTTLTTGMVQRSTTMSALSG